MSVFTSPSHCFKHLVHLCPGSVLGESQQFCQGPCLMFILAAKDSRLPKIPPSGNPEAETTIFHARKNHQNIVILITKIGKFTAQEI